MKNLIVVAALSFASIVNAQTTGKSFDTLSEYGQKSARLDFCGGYVQLTETYDSGVRRPLLQISGVNTHNCTFVEGNGVMIGRIKADGSAEVVVKEKPGVNLNTVVIRSQSGKHSDTVLVQSFGEVPTRPTQRNYTPNLVYSFGLFSSVLGASQTGYLPSCGGSATVSVDVDQVNIVFRNVNGNKCSKFDIIGANGKSVNYAQKNIPEQYSGVRSGSFTIPAKDIQLGANAIKVIVRSNSGNTDDVLLIQFASFN